MKGKRQRSAVWGHFHNVNKEEVVCDYCGDKIKKGGGTSNMFKHLERKHPNKVQIIRFKATPEVTDETGLQASTNGTLVCSGIAASIPVIDSSCSSARATTTEGIQSVVQLQGNSFTILEEEVPEDAKTVLVSSNKRRQRIKRKLEPSEKDLQIECLQLKKQKLVLEIHKLQEESELTKAKLVLEIDNLKEEKDKITAEKEFMRLKVMKLKMELNDL